ncbi:MAG TPA: tetratricopeptide repeat protein [bacterium]|nr:tetratricopeptide repeat protein [bacterium]
MAQRNLRTAAFTGCLVFLVLAAVFAAYYPSLGNGFVTSFDDDVLVVNNAKIARISWENVRSYFTASHAYLYHPLVLLSYAADYRFFGLNPAGYHATNLGLHLLNCLFVFFLFFLLSGNRWCGFLTALFFGIHPLHVESVAWISERKDLLCALFFLAALISYVFYVTKGKSRWIVVSGFFYIGSLLSKPMAVTLPLLLFLIDYLYGRSGSWRTVAEKIPFIALSVVFSVIAVVVHYENLSDVLVFSAAQKASAGCYNILFYLWKTAVPAGLSCAYRYPGWISSPAAPLSVLSVVAVVCAAAAAVLSTRYTKKVAFGTFFFFFSLLPVLHFFQVHTLGTPADRFAYIPLLGIFYLFGEAMIYCCRRAGGRVVKIAACLCVTAAACVCALLTWQRCQVWHDDVTLRTDMIGKDPGYWGAYYDRAIAYKDRREYEKALADLDTAISLYRGDARLFFDRGQVQRRRGALDKAIGDFSASLALNVPSQEKNRVAVLNERAMTFHERGDMRRAREDLDEALRLGLDTARSYFNRGVVALDCGDLDSAVADLSRALEIAGEKEAENRSAALIKRGLAYARKGEYERAAQDFSACIDLRPDMQTGWNNRAFCHVMLGQYDAAGMVVRIMQSRGMRVDPRVLQKIREAEGGRE